MELISRDEAIVMLEDMKGQRDEDGYIRVYKCDVIDNLRSLPTIEERKEGKWIKRDKWLYCSACDDGGWGLGAVTYGWQYCPSCGAKIIGE